MRNPFRCFNGSPEVIRLTVMYIRYPLLLRQVEDLLFERGTDICHETVRLWCNRFGPMFAAAIPNKRSVVPTDWRSGDETCKARPARGFSRQHPPQLVWFVTR